MKIYTAIDEDVNGQIVGSYIMVGSLHYEGRKQGGAVYADTEDAMTDAANQRIQQLRAECGAAFRDIYPKDAWELRIYAV